MYRVMKMWEIHTFWLCRVKAIHRTLRPMMRQGQTTGWALMSSDYSCKSRCGEFHFIIIPRKLKLSLLWKKDLRFVYCMTLLEKNSCSCDKLMSCVWMIVALFAVTAVASEGHYSFKCIPRFWNIQLMSLCSFWIDSWNRTNSQLIFGHSN